jgi:asparagine synthase (glutamine-hydrolysing)
MIEAPARQLVREFGGAWYFDRPDPDVSIGGPPYVSSLGNACTLDGRVDGHDGDCACLALSLYEQHGAIGLRGLLGDWSLAIWDRDRGEVVLASDYAGTRPLYYYRSARFVAWDTSLARLARRTGRTSLDLDYAAEYLASGFPVNPSPYEGICAVPAGCALTFSGRRTEKTVFWAPPLETCIRYGREEEYEEHFRAVFEQAVAVRLQTPGIVTSELSGGLDSSSIVCMADRLIRRGAVAAEGMLTFSFEQSGSPDLPYMAEVERACPSVRAVHVDLDDFPFLSRFSISASRPTFAETRLAEMRRHMESAGSGVVLTGQLGDLITGNMDDDSTQASDLMLAGRPGAAARELLAWSRSLRVPVYGLAWRALRAACGSKCCWRDPGEGEDSLTCSMRARVAEIERQHAAELVARATPSRRSRIFALQRMFASRFFQCPEPLDGLLYSHPYTHRPLLEFLLSIPPHVVCRPGERRRLMRRALKGILPDALLRRRSKGDYGLTFVKALRARASEMAGSPDSMLLVRMGCVDAGSIASRLIRLTRGLPCNEPQLRQLILLELWLRQRVEDGAIQQTR